MTTFREIARGYAQGIHQAAAGDRLRARFRTRSLLTESAVRQSALIAEFRRISSDIDRCQVQGRRIRPEEEHQIIRYVAEELGLRGPRELELILREASNDSFLDLADVIWDLLQEANL